MGCPPSEIRKWPHKDIIELAAYHQIQPFGVERDNWHFATLATMYASAHTPKGKPRPSVKDFMWQDRVSKHEERRKSFIGWLDSKVKN